MSKVPDENFDLRRLVRQIAEETSLRGPREIAAKAAEMVPAKQLRSALADVLPEFVRQMLQHNRQPGPQSAAGNKNSARSSMQRRIREGWRRTLAGQFHIGHGQWKVLSECTYDEVMFLAVERQEVARRTVAAADMFGALAKAIRKHKVTTAGELPEKVLAEILDVEDVAA